MEREEFNRLGGVIVDAALGVHRQFGPGLREAFYEAVLGRELQRRGLRVDRQLSVPYAFEEITFDHGLKLDILVEGAIIIELKCRREITTLHVRQLITYLKLLDKRLGYILNFGAPLMKQGIRRVANGL